MDRRCEELRLILLINDSDAAIQASPTCPWKFERCIKVTPDTSRLDVPEQFLVFILSNPSIPPGLLVS